MNKVAMKKILITISFLLLNLSCFAQYSSMHEALDDADGRGLLDALDGLGVIGGIIFFGVLAFVIIFALIPSKINDIKFEKKYKNRIQLLEDEASSILEANRLTYPYQKINSNSCFRQWFFDGYVEGVDKGREIKIRKPGSFEYEIFTIEEYVKRRHFESLRQELMGGDVKFSEIAFAEGMKHGAIRKETKGDSSEMLD